MDLEQLAIAVMEQFYTPCLSVHWKFSKQNDHSQVDRISHELPFFGTRMKMVRDLIIGQRREMQVSVLGVSLNQRNEKEAKTKHLQLYSKLTTVYSFRAELD
jgi:hypothetical protein